MTYKVTCYLPVIREIPIQLDEDEVKQYAEDNDVSIEDAIDELAKDAVMEMDYYGEGTSHYHSDFDNGWESYYDEE